MAGSELVRPVIGVSAVDAAALVAAGAMSAAFRHEGPEATERAGPPGAVLPTFLLEGPGTGAAPIRTPGRHGGGVRPCEEAVAVLQETGTGVHHTDLANTKKAAARKAGLGREFHA